MKFQYFYRCKFPQLIREKIIKKGSWSKNAKTKICDFKKASIETDCNEFTI